MKTLFTHLCKVVLIAAMLSPIALLAQNYTITINYLGDGSGTVAVTGTNVTSTGTNTYEAPANTEVTLTATPNQGSDFVSIKQGLSTRAAEPTRTYTFTLTGNVTFKATFNAAAQMYTVNKVVIPAGAGTISGDVSRPAGDAIYTATAETGFTFSRWVLADGTTLACPTCTDNSYTVTISKDTTLRALFEAAIIPHTVTASVNTSDYGTAVLTNNTRTGASDFNEGESATLTVTPNDGYFLESVTDGGNTLFSGHSTDAYSYNFTVDGDHEFEAVFAAPESYTVTIGSVRPSAAGTAGCTANVDGANSKTVVGGTAVLLTAVEAGGYNFVCWSTTTTPSGSVSTDNPWQYAVTGNTTVYALFQQGVVNRTVTLSSNGNGTVSPNGSSTVENGGTLQISATPADCYEFTEWSDHNTDNPRTLTVNSDLNLSATFSQITYEVATGSYTGGSVSSSVASPVACGSEVVLTATPTTGYTFTEWSDHNTNNPRTYNNVRANINITPTFTLNSYEVAATSNTDGCTASVNATPVNHGGSAIFSATPDDCHTFLGWYNNGVFENAANPYNKTITEPVSLEARFQIVTYSVTVNQAEHGTVVASSASVDCGGSVSFTVTPDNGYAFTGWVEGGSAQEFTNVHANIVRTPVFSANSYAMSVSAGMGGTAGVSPTSVAHGGSATFTATPNTCYEFLGWYNNGVLENNAASYTKTNITGAVSLEARFQQLTYTVTSGDVTNGSVSASVANPVTCGTTVRLTATPATGYTFTEWTDHNTDNPRDVVVNANFTETPVFSLNTFSVSASVNPTEAGSFTLNGNAASSGTFEYGDDVEVEFLVDAENYNFTGWTVNGSNGGNNNPYSINNIAAAYTLVANVTPVVRYTVTLNQAEGGTATVNGVAGPVSVVAGNSVTLAATPNSAAPDFYQFDGWQISAGNAPTGNPVEFTPTANVTLTPRYTQNIPTYTVTITANPVAGGAPTATGTFTHGGTVVLNPNPTNGYTFVNFTENGVAIESPITNLDANHEIVANYTIQNFAIGATTDGNGTVTGAGDYGFGATATLTATPNADYVFDYWSENGVRIEGAGATYTFTVNGARNLVANFAYQPVRYTVTLSVYPAASGSVTGAGEYVHDTPVTINATPEAHYEFAGWYYTNGNPFSAVAENTFNATHDTTLQARFNAINYTITTNVQPSAAAGRVEVSGDTYYGATYRMNAIANDGYHFVQWHDGNTNANRSISVSGNATYVAQFEEDAIVPPTPIEDDVLTYLDSTRRVVTGIRADLRERIITVRIPSTVQRIANRAFVGATSMEHVTIPATVDTIGDSAFFRCANLVSVNLPNQLNYLGKFAFYGCSGLEAVSMPAVLDTLRNRTFAECTALRRIELPSTLKEVGPYALYYCQNIYQLTIPASVDTIRENAFALMTSMRFVTIEGGNHYFSNEAFRYSTYSWNNYAGHGSIQLTSFRGTMAEWLTNNFQNYTATPMFQSSNFAINGEILTELTIPAGTQNINGYAFYNDDQLTTITIPASVDSIGAYSFAELNGLERIILLGIPKVNAHAFDNVSNDVVVMVPCEKLDSIRTAGWSHFNRFNANGVPMIEFRRTMGGYVNVLQEPTCTDHTARFEAVAGEYYDFLSWSDGNSENPRTMVLEQDEVMAALFTRKSNVSPVLAKNNSFDTDIDRAAWGLPEGEGMWYIGNPNNVTPKNGDACMYFSVDGGTNSHYGYWNNNYAYAEFYLQSGTYNIRFHWNGGGINDNGYGDYMNAYLLPDENNFDFSDYNVIRVADTLQNSNDWQYQNCFVSVPSTGWYKLTFRWQNEYYYDETPAMAVDNIHIQFQDDDYLEGMPVTLRVVSNDENLGTVTGSGLYYYNDMVEITATPEDGYQFNYWSDGNTDAIRTVRAGDFAGTNVQLVAYFGERQWRVTTTVSPANTARTEGDSLYFTNDEVTLRVVEPQEGWAFMGWSTDGVNVDNGTADPYVFNITSDVTLTAIMQQVRDTIWVVRIVNAPGDTTTEYYTEDPRYTTSPSPNPDGIGFQEGGRTEVIEVMNVKIYASMGQIVVEDANGQMVTVYDVNGRRLAQKLDTTGKLYFDVPITGTYMVRIGELITRKVVVMR